MEALELRKAKGKSSVTTSSPNININPMPIWSGREREGGES